MTTETRQVPAVITRAGEILELGELHPITADDAGLLLPQVREVLAQVRRYEGWLVQVVSDEMKARGQRERRAGETVYELKAEAEWVVDDLEAMANVLDVAVTRSDITSEECQKAHQVVISHRYNHTALNVLAKRVPEIDQHRRRIEGEPRLRTKS